MERTYLMLSFEAAIYEQKTLDMTQSILCERSSLTAKSEQKLLFIGFLPLIMRWIHREKEELDSIKSNLQLKAERIY